MDVPKEKDAAGQNVGPLIRLLDRQRQLYRQLDQLSERQRSLISSDKPKDLLKVVGQRHKIVQALGELDDQLEPYRQDWQQACKGLDVAEKSELDGILNEVHDLLGRIIARDQQDGQTLAARGGRMHQGVSGQDKSGQLVGLYAGQEQMAGERSDNSGSFDQQI